MRTLTRTFSVLTVVLLLFLGGSLFAQATKIGFVNSQEVLYGTNEGKAGLEALDKFMAGKRQEYETKNSNLGQLQQDYQAKSRTLNADALREMEREIDRLQREMRRFEEDAQAEFNQRQNEMLQTMSEKVQVIIESYAQQNAFAVIFMRDQTQAYVAPALDVTQQIIAIYNERHPGPTAAGQ